MVHYLSSFYSYMLGVGLHAVICRS